MGKRDEGGKEMRRHTGAPMRSGQDPAGRTQSAMAPGTGRARGGSPLRLAVRGRGKHRGHGRRMCANVEKEVCAR